MAFSGNMVGVQPSRINRMLSPHLLKMISPDAYVGMTATWRSPTPQPCKSTGSNRCGAVVRGQTTSGHCGSKAEIACRGGEDRRYVASCGSTTACYWARNVRCTARSAIAGRPHRTARPALSPARCRPTERAFAPPAFPTPLRDAVLLY